jgi:hypothetical protein
MGRSSIQLKQGNCQGNYYFLKLKQTSKQHTFAYTSSVEWLILASILRTLQAYKKPFIINYCTSHDNMIRPLNRLTSHYVGSFSARMPTLVGQPQKESSNKDS